MWSKPINLTDTVSKYHRLSILTNEQDAFGIEIELEGKNIRVEGNRDFNQYWQGVGDGSLRALNPGDQAVEYRSRYPYNMSTIDMSVKMLNSCLSQKGVEIYDSGRASVHVHVNMGHDKMSTLYNFITLAIIFDELLVSQNGKNRVGNNFCFRFKDAEGAILAMSHSLRARGDLQGIQPDHRYSSVNICSLFKFGTIEFRSMECTVEYSRLMAWVRTLQALKIAARNFNNPLEIISNFSLRGPDQFFFSILKDQALPYIQVPGRSRMLMDGIRLAQEFTNASTWTPIPVEELAAKKPSKLDQLLENEVQRQAQAEVAFHAQPVNFNEIFGLNRAGQPAEVAENAPRPRAVPPRGIRIQPLGGHPR